MERPPKPDLLYGPRALTLDAFISSLEAWGKQGWDHAEKMEAAIIIAVTNIEGDPSYPETERVLREALKP